jgi:myosin heavy subunit
VFDLSGQLCINFTNERLAKGFVDVVFKREQAEYLSEGVPWESIMYVCCRL